MNRAMNLKGMLVLGLALGLGGCPGGTPVADAGPDSQVATVSLFNGMYTTARDVSNEQALVTASADLFAKVGMAQWSALDQASGMSSPVMQMLNTVDQHFLGASQTSSPDALAKNYRDGITRGMTMPGAVDQDVAKELVEKSLIVGLELTAIRHVRMAIDALVANNFTDARTSWDRAAVIYSAIDAFFVIRTSASLPGVWGAGVDMLTDENLSARMIDLFVRGRGAIENTGRRVAIDLASQLEVYLTKYNFLSAVKYGYEVAEVVGTGGTPTPEMNEGRLSFNGVWMPRLGQSTDSLVTAARARWTGAPAGLSRTTVLRDSAGLYALQNAADVTSFATANDTTRWMILGRMRATVDALDEALVYGRVDLAATRTKLDTARMMLDAGNASMAQSLLAEINTSVMSLTTAGN